jgi:sigma-B regulation protein RsbU (phosphoserine phosphatase)
MNEPKPNLLIVEDSPVYAEILLRLLPSLGAELQFETQWVDSAEKGMEQLQARRYEVVLLDYRLPGADGLAVLGQIRSLPREIQPAVIMLTGMGNEEVAVEAMKNGASDYLPKDNLDVPSLIRAITSALERRRLEKQVARYTEELRVKNQELEADLNMAHEIQQALLPDRYPTLPRGVAPEQSSLRFCHRYQPTSAVGGDFLDVFALSDTQAGIFICDVVGHGVRAALVTAIVRALVEESIPMGQDAGHFLTHINRRLLAILQKTRAPMFATAAYLVADVGRGDLQYALAGHPSPLHVKRRAERVEMLDFDQQPSGPALGVFEEGEFPAAKTTLAEGDLVMLYTDGLYEVTCQNDEQFGLARLVDTVRAHLKLPCEQLFDELLREIHRQSSTKEFDDDVCLVGMEVVKIG